jgi:4-hydroxy-tetrahydrodipicolinate synthase
VPSRTGLDIPVSVYRELAEIPNIAGIKEASGDIGKVSAVLAECPDLTLWTGNDDQIVPAMALGAKGVISVVSNILPVKTKALADAALDGDFDTAAALQLEMLPLIKTLFSEVNPIPVKTALAMCGKCSEEFRLPMCAMSDENKTTLREILEKYGVS